MPFNSECSRLMFSLILSLHSTVIENVFSQVVFGNHPLSLYAGFFFFLFSFSHLSLQQLLHINFFFSSNKPPIDFLFFFY